MNDIHPLQAYLDARGEKPYEFADRAGIGKQTVYDLLKGTFSDALVSTLSKIEVATGGKVTVRQMIDWINRQPGSQV